MYFTYFYSTLVQLSKTYVNYSGSVRAYSTLATPLRSAHYLLLHRSKRRGRPKGGTSRSTKWRRLNEMKKADCTAVPGTTSDMRTAVIAAESCSTTITHDACISSTTVTTVTDKAADACPDVNDIPIAMLSNMTKDRGPEKFVDILPARAPFDVCWESTKRVPYRRI